VRVGERGWRGWAVGEIVRVSPTILLPLVPAQVSPEHTEKFARLVPALVKIMRKLLQADPVSEYNVGGVTDPFLQVGAGV
jgi:hypothetical protein